MNNELRLHLVCSLFIQHLFSFKCGCSNMTINRSLMILQTTEVLGSQEIIIQGTFTVTTLNGYRQQSSFSREAITGTNDNMAGMSAVVSDVCSVAHSCSTSLRPTQIIKEPSSSMLVGLGFQLVAYRVQKQEFPFSTHFQREAEYEASLL